MKKKTFKIINIIEPILFILLSVGIIYTIIFSFSNVNWIALGGTLREWYWYETLIMDATEVLLVVFCIIEIVMFFSIKRKYKYITIIYTLIEFLAIYGVWCIETFASLIAIFVFNLIKCIYRIVKSDTILKTKENKA